MMVGLFCTVPAWAMDLPDDVVKYTFAYLPPQSLTKVALVSRQWNRISEDAELWKQHGVSSKKECLAFPELEYPQLGSLFKTKYLSGNGLFFWKIVETFETPDEIIRRIGQGIWPRPTWAKWDTSPILCTKKDSGEMEVMTELTFVADEQFLRLFYKKIPCTLTLKGTWCIEN